MYSRLLTVLAVSLFVLPAFPNAGPRMPNDPGDARLITSDITHFWEAFDAMAGGDSANVMQTIYFDRGSQGLTDFVRLRIGDAGALLDVIEAHPRYYAALRESSLRVATMETDIFKSFQNLKRIYPDAHFPNVYFLIGRMNSGGTTSDAGLLIGTDMYGLADGTPVDELGEWHRQVIKPINGIPYIVAHELIHFQQPPLPGDKRTLLAACIREGSADFISELISGRHVNGHVHDFCLPREAELWSEFEEVMDGGEYDGWLYGGQPEGRPADIGYFIGYRIAQSYYEQADDKQAAISDILLVDDFPAFLIASGYAP